MAAMNKVRGFLKGESAKETLQDTFEKAGKEQGLEIWRIVDLLLEEVPLQQHGHFYTGDSYILLETTKFRDGSRRWNIFYWLGEYSTQDETTAAPIITTQMSDYLGDPVQFREVQGAESKAFLKLFNGKAGIYYKDGGHDSVRWTAGVKSNIRSINRVLHIKGKRNVRAKEVPFSWNSFNSGDCFVIEIDNKIFKWKGSKANRLEIFKANEIATELRDGETGGRAEIRELEEGGFVPDIIKNSDLGPPPEKFNPATEDDVPIEKLMQQNQHQNSKSVNNSHSIRDLYHVSSDTGELIVKKISSTPNIKRSEMLTGDCYILDASGEGAIYVWKGKEASPDERSGAFENAHEFKDNKGYKHTIRVVSIPENTENTFIVFKQCFDRW